MQITGTSGDDHLVGTTGNDQFDVFQGGNDRLEGDAGGDIFRFGSTYTSADRVDGGADSDSVELTGTYVGTITLSHMISVEALAFLSGAFEVRALDGIVAAGALMTVGAASLNAAQALVFDASRESDGRYSFNLGAGNDVITGGDGNDSFGATVGGDDTLVGGLGDDGFFFGAQFTTADRANGGDGADTLQFNGDYSAGIVFGKHSAESMETMQLLGAHSYTVTTHDTTVSAGATMTVSASLSSGFVLVFDGSNEKDGSFTISAGTGADRLTGGDGDDSFTGANGADVLAGLGGADTFKYANAGQSTGSAHDTIRGFVAADDLIDTPAVIVAIDDEVTHGKLTNQHFDAQLAHAVGESDLGVAHAVLFTPDRGSLAGHVFLVVNLNATAGYQAGLDLVIELGDADLAGFGTANFI